MMRLFLIGLAVLTLSGCAQQGGSLATNELTDTPTYGRFIWHDLLTDPLKGCDGISPPC